MIEKNARQKLGIGIAALGILALARPIEAEESITTSQKTKAAPTQTDMKTINPDLEVIFSNKNGVTMTFGKYKDQNYLFMVTDGESGHCKVATYKIVGETPALKTLGEDYKPDPRYVFRSEEVDRAYSVAKEDYKNGSILFLGVSERKATFHRISTLEESNNESIAKENVGTLIELCTEVHLDREKSQPNTQSYP